MGDATKLTSVIFLLIFLARAEEMHASAATLIRCIVTYFDSFAGSNSLGHPSLFKY